MHIAVRIFFFSLYCRSQKQHASEKLQERELSEAGLELFLCIVYHHAARHDLKALDTSGRGNTSQAFSQVLFSTVPILSFPQSYNGTVEEYFS